MRGIWMALAGFGLAACQSVSTVTQPAVQVDRVVVFPVVAEAVAVKLSGETEPHPEWEQAIELHLSGALTEELESRGIAVNTGDWPDPAAALRAQLVLPEAARGKSLPTAKGPGHWSLGPLMSGDDTVLLITHRTAPTTSGHRIAEIGLGLAFANPLMPDAGRTTTYAALANAGSGTLLWVRQWEGGEARTHETARKIAERIAARFEARGP